MNNRGPAFLLSRECDSIKINESRRFLGILFSDEINENFFFFFFNLRDAPLFSSPLFFSLFMPFYICRCSPNPLCLIGTYPLTPGDDTSSSISNNPIYQDAPENTKLFMYPHPQHPLSFPSSLYFYWAEIKRKTRVLK